MVFQKSIIVIVAICAFYLYSSVLAQDSTCKGAVITMKEDRQRNVNYCLYSVGAVTLNDIAKERYGCFVRCVMENQGLIDTSGTLLKGNITNYLEVGIPDSVQGPLTMEIGNCFDQAGGKMNMDDMTCAEFKPLCDCIQRAYPTVCN